MTRWWSVVALALAALTFMCPVAFAQGASHPDKATSAAAPSRDKIRITGYVNACYQPNGSIGFISAISRTYKFESPSVRLNKTGRFVIDLKRADLTPGDYTLRFGKTRSGAGYLRFTVKPETTVVDLGQVGDGDV